jgi:hypothetical protein
MKRGKVCLVALAAPFVLGALFALRSQDPPPGQDSQPIRRPDTSYMGQWMNRNTRPLGLRGDQAHARLIEQPRINWAIRASVRHILD